jgi:hypothetical protein
MKHKTAKLLFSFFVFFVLHKSTSAQKFDFWLELAGNRVLIPDVSVTYHDTPFISLANGYSYYFGKGGLVRELYTAGIGGKMGMGINYNISPRLALSSSPGFFLATYKRTIEVVADEIEELEFPDGSGYHRDSSMIDFPVLQAYDNSNNGKTRLYTFQLPLCLKYSTLSRRLSFRAGITASFLFFSQQYANRINYDYERKIIVNQEYIDRTGNGLNRTSLLLNTGINIKLWRNSYLTAEYLKQLTTLYVSSEQLAGKAKMQVLNLGLSIRLSK